MATDPYPYGVKENRKVLETIAEYSHEQGLTPRVVKLEEVFAPARWSSNHGEQATCRGTISICGARFASVALVLLTSISCGSGGQPAKTSSTGATGSNSQSGTALEWQQAVDAAKKEKLVVVATPVEAYEQFIDAFRKAYPEIQVDLDEERPDQFAPKALTEQKNGLYNFDVWIGRTSNMNAIVLPAGGFQDITPFLILSSVKDPKNWNGGKLLFTSDKGNCVLENNLLLGPSIWVNRDVVPKSQFSNPDQLLDPVLKGKISYRTPTAPHGGSLFLTGALHAKGPDFVQKLLTQQGLIFQDNAQIARDLTDSGEDWDRDRWG